MNTETLRKLAMESNDGVLRGPAMRAADTIEADRAEYARLKADNERLREALEKIGAGGVHDEPLMNAGRMQYTARAALGEKS